MSIGSEKKICSFSPGVRWNRTRCKRQPVQPLQTMHSFPILFCFVDKIMAYFHCQTQIQIRTQIRIPVLRRIFPLVQIQTLIPWLKRDGDLSLGWRSVPEMDTVTIWERDPNPNLSPSPYSGNMSCIILCSHRVWNPSTSLNLNPSPALEISHKTHVLPDQVCPESSITRTVCGVICWKNSSSSTSVPSRSITNWHVLVEIYRKTN